MIKEGLTAEGRELFLGAQDKMIQSALTGMMGRGFTKTGPGPLCAAVAVGDFLFLSGTADPVFLRELMSALAPVSLILRGVTGDWADAVKTVLPEAEQYSRYRVGKGAFDRAVLERFAQALPPGYRLEPMEAGWYGQLLSQEWSRDFCSLFKSEEDYAQRGLGVLVVQGDLPVAGASSYAVYPQGIEIELDTSPQHRRKGLARAAAAALILRCLEQGLEPHWDADNLTSVHIAEQLGYIPGEAYLVWKWAQGKK